MGSFAHDPFTCVIPCSLLDNYNFKELSKRVNKAEICKQTKQINCDVKKSAVLFLNGNLLKFGKIESEAFL